MGEQLYDLELVIYWEEEGEAVPVLRMEGITADKMVEVICLADYPGGSTAGWRATARQEAEDGE